MEKTAQEILDQKRKTSIRRRAHKAAGKVYVKNSIDYVVMVNTWVEGYNACEADYEKWRNESLDRDQEY